MSDKVLEQRLKFECDMCSNCIDRNNCNHVYDYNKCESLKNALIEAGFIRPVEDSEEKIKVTQADVIAQKTDSGPYFLIKYKEVGKEDYTVGFGSYNFDYVLGRLSENFEIVKDNITQFPVDMDGMQRDIMVCLLNARKECTEQNLLTARGCVAMIDALFYLVKERPIVAGIDMGVPGGDKTGGLT